MNKHIIMGRLTKDPEVRYGGSQNIRVARFTLAVDRRYKRENQPTADFFQLTAFGKTGEFVEKYLSKGVKVVIDGEMQNNNYTNKEGRKVYGFRVVVNQIEFAESKKTSQQNTERQAESDEFINIPEGIDGELPFAD